MCQLDVPYRSTFTHQKTSKNPHRQKKVPDVGHFLNSGIQNK